MPAFESLSRSAFYRSRARGCLRAAGLATRKETRELFVNLAAQWHDMAAQLDLIDLLFGPPPAR